METFFINKNKQSSKWILFLHGWGTTYKTLIPLEKNVKAKYNTISILLPFSEEFKINKPFKIEEVLLYVHQILIQNQIIPDIIVAHSCGAKVAMLYALNIKDVPLILLSPSILKPRFNFKKYLAIKKYKIHKKHFKSHHFLNNLGSEDYKKCKGNLKRTFLKMVHCYFDKEVNKIKSKVVIILGKDDQEVDNYKLIKLCRRKSLFIKYLIKGNHFAYLRHANLILQVINDYANL